jgi:L-lactate dehydrogenase complex protein LldG
VDAATPKEEFLQTVRQALGKASPTTNPQRGKSTEERERQVAEIEQHLVKGRPELLDSLAEVASKVSWQVHRTTSHEEAAQLLAAIAKEKGVRSALHSSHTVLDRISLAKALPGVSLTLMESQDESGWAALREKAPEADLGVTGTDYAVAETGSCVILSKPGVSRMTSLLPPVHVAIVEPQQVLADLDELFILLGAAYAQDRLSPYLNLISGPSRTGDIEQTLVIGAHGPKKAHLIIIG